MEFAVDTRYPIAADSEDHKTPFGTKIDNSSNPAFCDTAIRYFNGCVSTLDLGCSGGGMILDFLQRDQPAVGLEGSDYSKWAKRAAWGIIPYNLFTCDISELFRIAQYDPAIKEWNWSRFNLITLWEVFEHILPERQTVLFRNIRQHLAKGGILVASIAFGVDGWYHATIRPREWWLSFAEKEGFAQNEYLRSIFFPVRVRDCPWDNFFVWEFNENYYRNRTQILYPLHNRFSL